MALQVASEAYDSSDMSLSLVAREVDLDLETESREQGSVTTAILKCEERLGGDDEEEEVTSRPSATFHAPAPDIMPAAAASLQHMPHAQPQPMSIISSMATISTGVQGAGTTGTHAAHTTVQNPTAGAAAPGATPATIPPPAPGTIPTAVPKSHAGTGTTATALPGAQPSSPGQQAPAAGGAAAVTAAMRTAHVATCTAPARCTDVPPPSGTTLRVTSREATPSSNASCSHQEPSSPSPSASSSSSSSSDEEDEHHSHHHHTPRSWVTHLTAPVTPSPRDNAVGLVYDGCMELHRGPTHAEHPARITVLASQLEQDGLMGRCWALPGAPSSDEHLLLAHDVDHIRKGADLYVCEGTAAAARMAAGCCVAAVQGVLRGDVGSAFAVVRPPGHHAECERAQGFCFFNNCAVAARVALQDESVQRVVVLDWDVHHGNGIQHVLWYDPRALYISLHRSPKNFYPYNAGFVEEVGAGEGEGFNINVPWIKKGMGDADYLAAFDLVVEPVLAAFDPHMIIVAAGFDAARGDPLGGCNLSPEGYAAMTRRLMRHANGRVVVALEGGYNTRVTAACAAACVRALLGEEVEEQQGGQGPAESSPSPSALPPPSSPAPSQLERPSPSLPAGLSTGGTSTTSSPSSRAQGTRNGAAAAAQPAMQTAGSTPATTTISNTNTNSTRNTKPWQRSAAERAAMAAAAAAGGGAGGSSGANNGGGGGGCQVFAAGGSQEGPRPSAEAIRTLRQVCEVQAQYWPVLGDFEERWRQYESRLPPVQPPERRVTRSSAAAAAAATS